MAMLPVFKGYTVDVRLRQFRKVAPGHRHRWPGIEFVDFESPKGQRLLRQMRQTCEALTVQE